MNDTYLGMCNAARERFRIGEDVDCCNSCHEDLEEGYADMLVLDVAEGWFHVCCKIHSEVERLRNQQWQAQDLRPKGRNE